MTDQNSQAPTQQPVADLNAPVVTPQVVYIKDCSFEAPNGPFVGGLQGQPAVNLNIQTRASALAQDLHEVVLQVSLEAKSGDKVVWLLELQQAGAFVIKQSLDRRPRPGAVDRRAELPALVRALDGVGPRRQGGLPAVPAAARDVRSTARAGRGPAGREQPGNRQLVGGYDGQLNPAARWGAE